VQVEGLLAVRGMTTAAATPFISHHERIVSSLTWPGNAAAASAHSRV
jgi:hypothetical protein